MQPPSRETGAAVSFIDLRFVTEFASYQSQMRILTDKENAAFDKWKSECEKTEVVDGDGEIVGVSYGHPSTRITLDIPPMNKSTRKTVISERWCCGIDAHRHLTERVALACIEKHARKVGPTYPKRNQDEMAKFARRRESGETWLSIASDMGVSIERARQLIAKHKRQEG